MDNRFYFYSNFHENQANFFNYIDNFIERYNTIPSQGNYKSYQSSLFENINGFDFQNAQAYLGYKTSKHSLLELGHGRHFIGNGIRSLLLSDFSHNYLYLRFNISVWKINYQTIIAELSPFSSQQTIGNTVLPNKYMASHYLSFAPNKKLNIGLFETVIFSRQNQFEFQYLNPVILYRTVEGLIDSPDNVLLGLNLNWYAFNKSSLYAQLLIDELRFGEIFSGDNWWGNKWGLQLGIKSFDLFGVKQLDGQMEFNMVRPYTYSHLRTIAAFPEQSFSNYSHYNQALAHPLGANFAEYLLRFRYRPTNKWRFILQFLYARAGRNQGLINYGGDILLNNSSRISDYNIDLFQGAVSDIRSIDLQSSFRLSYDLYLDLYLKIRQDTDESLENVRTNFVGLGFRFNIETRNIDF